MADPTEAARRALLAEMPEVARRAVEKGEPVWDTAALREEFDVIGFLAPFVSVRRKSDGQKGSLLFSHAPRWYFGWKEDNA